MQKENFAAQKETAKKKLNANGGNVEATGMPIVEGTVMTFDVSNVENIANFIHTGVFRNRGYAYIESTEGYRLSQSQIARNNNGLELKPALKSDMMLEFIERIVDAPNQTLGVRVSGVLTKEFKEGLAQYFNFEVIGGNTQTIEATETPATETRGNNRRRNNA